MNIVITGSTGFIGSAVANYLLTKTDHTIIVAGRSEERLKRLYSSTKAIFLTFDIVQKRENWFEYCHKPDLLLHFAWGELKNFNASTHISSELPIHISFLSDMITQGLKNLMVAGTCLEYGLANGALSENMVTNPTTPYGIAKDTLQKYLDLFCKENRCSLKWIRYFYMYGDEKNKKPNSLLALLEDAIKKGDTTFKMSVGTQLRDFLSIKEVARYSSIVALSSFTGIINICSGRPTSVRELVERRCKELKASITLHRGYYPLPQYEPIAFWGDNEKLKIVMRDSI